MNLVADELEAKDGAVEFDCVGDRGDGDSDVVQDTVVSL